MRDAQGNPLAVYDNSGGGYYWREQDLYGSSRLGIWTPNVKLANNNAAAVYDTVDNKFFELSNHLGNVLATITDRRVQIATGGNTLGHYNADLSTAQDYYAFGMLQPGKQYTANNTTYRYGFNSKENDNDVGQVLPTADANNNPITYREYDIHPKVKGQNRAAERVVIGSNGKSYYTNDHYKTFTEIKTNGTTTN